jgi:hypothetical protein
LIRTWHAVFEDLSFEMQERPCMSGIPEILADVGKCGRQIELDILKLRFVFVKRITEGRTALMINETL